MQTSSSIRCVQSTGESAITTSNYPTDSAHAEHHSSAFHSPGSKLQNSLTTSLALAKARRQAHLRKSLVVALLHTRIVMRSKHYARHRPFNELQAKHMSQIRCHCLRRIVPSKETFTQQTIVFVASSPRRRRSRNRPFFIESSKTRIVPSKGRLAFALSQLNLADHDCIVCVIGQSFQ